MIKKYIAIIFTGCVGELILLHYGAKASPIFQGLSILLTICLCILLVLANEYYLKNKSGKIYIILDFLIISTFALCSWLGITIIFIIVDIYDNKPLSSWSEYCYMNRKAAYFVFLPWIFLNAFKALRVLCKKDKNYQVCKFK
ncbi:hypothetical protein [Candidatus Tisiphia endosymbiont of Myopa tessellatipennis]|uniref:hypothetical protein n=1 Tax=Candidatus Tisiphia endosymbiont of Myopa tessellatipennis TaxID=3066257 RepID=UPI00313AC3A8